MKLKEDKTMKSMIDELMGYRVKLEKDGRDIFNIPGILALPGVLLAPKASIIGTVAASLLGCNIHLENEKGKAVDVGEKVRKAADTVADTAKTAAKRVREEMDKAWEAVSADDPEGCPEGEENEEEPAEDTSGGDSVEHRVEVVVEKPEKPDTDDIPIIEVKSDDSAET